MSVSAVGAAYAAIRARLAGGSELWGTRVYADLAPDNAKRPFVVYTFMGGGERNRLVRVQDASLVVAVRVVADTLGQAFEGAARLAELLDDAGLFDGVTDMQQTGWYITTTSVEQPLHLMEMVDGVRVYHAGFQLRLTMEQKQEA